MPDDYQPVALGDIEALLQDRLASERRTHGDALAAHIAAHMPIYEAYPFREGDGRPASSVFTEEEKQRLCRVMWPRTVQRLLPGLRDQPLVSGAEMADRKTSPSQSPRRLRDKFMRPLKLLAWTYGTKDTSRYREAVEDRWRSQAAASKAWAALQPDALPRLPDLVEWLQKRADTLDSYKRDLAAQGLPQAVWLTSDERDDLRRAFLTGKLEALCIATGPLDFQGFRDTYGRLSRQVEALEALAADANLQEVSHPELLARIIETARLDPRTDALLRSAQESEITLHLVESDKSKPRGPGAMTAYLRGNDLYLVDADETNIGDGAVFLIHELRHNAERKALGPLFDQRDDPVDILCRTRVLEADAWAYDLSSAFILKQKGVAVSWWSGEETLSGMFEQLYRQGIEARQMDAETALEHATSACFTMFVSGFVDYEQRWALVYPESARRPDLAERIAASPFLNADVINKITLIGDHSYLSPHHLPLIETELRKLPEFSAMRPLDEKATPLRFNL